MATDLALPGGLRPSNLHLPEHMKHALVESDLYGICERIKEISPDLYIILLDDGEDTGYVIMEHCRDGIERLVFKVRELDGRVEQRLRELMAVPLETRIELADKENHRIQEQERERQLDELYERIGAPMWGELERCGFIQRGVSYPKAGVATAGRFRR